MEERMYNAGDVILEEGDPSDFAYRIVSGEVEVFTRLGDQITVLGPVKAGEFLGENRITAGGVGSPFTFKALLERA